MIPKPERYDFFLERFVVGPLEANCYLLADPETRDACLIDPGGNPPEIADSISRGGLKLRFVVNTHGHGDHIAANSFFMAPIYIHRLDAPFLTDPEKNLSAQFLFRVKSPEASRLLEDKETIILGNLAMEVIHTPGHTPGSICLKIGDVIFSGDTLFRAGIGRTDIPGGDGRSILESIRRRLFIYADDTVIYPGHGEPSTIGEER